MKKIAIFVGYILKSNLDILIKEGYEVGFFEDKYRPQKSENFINDILPHLSFVYPVDFSTFKRIEKSLDGFQLHRESILICNRDNYFLAQAKIANLLGINQSKLMDIEVARNITNKFFQRRLFSKHYPEITVPTKRIETFHHAYMFVRKNGFPVIVKPANLSQGKLVHICNNLEELIQNVSYVLDTVADVYKSQNVKRKPQVIMEKFIDGKQYSVDSYIDIEGNIIHTPVCKQTISYELGFGDFQTYYSGYPSYLDSKKESQVLDAVTKSIKSLDIKGTPTHVEVKITESGEPKIIEVNIRPGGYRSDMLRESYGVNHIKNMVNVYTGKEVQVKDKLLKHSACPQFWAESEGKLVKIHGSDGDIQKLPSFVRYGSLATPGEMVGRVTKGYKKTCYAILAHEDEEQLKEDLIKIRDIIKIEVEKPS